MKRHGHEACARLIGYVVLGGVLLSCDVSAALERSRAQVRAPGSPMPQPARRARRRPEKSWKRGVDSLRPVRQAGKSHKTGPVRPAGVKS